MVFVYMDDIMILGSTYAEWRASVPVVRSTFQEAGFLVNAENRLLSHQRLSNLGGWKLTSSVAL